LVTFANQSINLRAQHLSPLSQKSEGKHCAKNAAEGRKKKIKKKNEGKSTENEKLRSTIKEPSMRGTGFGLFQGGRGLEWAGCFVQRY